MGSIKPGGQGNRVLSEEHLAQVSLIPSGELSRQHVLIPASNSWASTWHVKTVDEGKLGDFIGQASPDELEDVIEALGLCLDQRHAPGQIATRRGAFTMRQEQCGGSI